MADKLKGKLTVERLREVYEYEPIMGKFTRRMACGNSQRYKVGQAAGTVSPCGKVAVGIDRAQYAAAILAVFYVTGRAPHRVYFSDGDTTNIAYGNLIPIFKDVKLLGRDGISAELARAMVNYDPDTGVFTWRIRTTGTTNIGDIAGGVNSQGYWSVCLNGKHILGHRLAYLIQTGEWPKDQIDHRDLDKLNNRWKNIRNASNSGNVKNRKARKDSTTGVKNVHAIAATGKFRCRIRSDYVMHDLGVFDTLSAAKSVADKYRPILHGKFYNNG